MKAAVFTGPYEFKICDREKPKPGPKEVLIRIRAVGICGSDIHPYMGDGIDRREPGIIMGHEASGDVEEVGSEVNGNLATELLLIHRSMMRHAQCVRKDFHICVIIHF